MDFVSFGCFVWWLCWWCFFIARKQFEKEIGEHPRLTPDAIREMMSQMGQKPSEAKIQQTYRNIIKQSKAAAAKAKK